MEVWFIGVGVDGFCDVFIVWWFFDDNLVGCVVFKDRVFILTSD